MTKLINNKHLFFIFGNYITLVFMVLDTLVLGIMTLGITS